MKITRALLLSSKKQAGLFEAQAEGRGLFSKTRNTYLYSVTRHRASGNGLIFEIYRITRETYIDNRKQECERDKIADTPHVHEAFKDAGELINFLRRYQIDFEERWQPVENTED